MDRSSSKIAALPPVWPGACTTRGEPGMSSTSPSLNPRRGSKRGTGAVPAGVRDPSGRQPVRPDGMRATVSLIPATRPLLPLDVCALVGEVRETLAEGAHSGEAQGRLVAGLAEQALAGPEHDREYRQPHFVDEVVLHQRVYQPGAGVHHDVAS